MPYVRRDADGRISAVSDSAASGCGEYLEVGNSELEAFLRQLRPSNELASTDLDFVRVLEDLLDVLIAKNVLLFTELPPEAQQKVLARQALRSSDNALDLLRQAAPDDKSGPLTD